MDLNNDMAKFCGPGKLMEFPPSPVGTIGKFAIPARFKLLGHTIEVKRELGQYHDYGRYGSANFEGKWIKIEAPSLNLPITQSSLEHTFFHELVHFCLYHTEQSSLNGNENFVDALAGLLHQALTSMEYDQEQT